MPKDKDVELQRTNSVLFPLPVAELLKALSSVGFFDESLLIGSWVMPLYREFFDMAYVLRTMDIDFAVQLLPGKKAPKTNLPDLIVSLGFIPFFTQSGIQKFSREGFSIEFIAHRRGNREEERVLVPEWNITAIFLPFINFLLDFSFAAECGGTVVRAPIPEAFFLHKLITATRRPREDKRSKDLEQCAVIAPRLNPERLQNVCRAVKLGARTKAAVRSSCRIIGFPPQSLGL